MSERSPSRSGLLLIRRLRTQGRKNEIRAQGRPGGGTYVWSSSAPLVNILGKPDYSSSSVYLWDFKADNSISKISEKTVQVSVTNIHP